jgi:hypothetical protein
MINIIKKRLFSAIALVCILVTVLGYFIFLAVNQNKKTAILDILVAPSGATVKLNGHGILVGQAHVAPGNYVIKVSRQGFAEKEQTVSVAGGETRFVGIILVSNDASTALWYENHPEDDILTEKIVGQVVQQESADAVLQNPFIEKLPILGPGDTYRIDSGVSLAGSSQPAIYILAVSPKAREAAINKIKYMGYDPEKMEIIYSAEAP